MTLTDLTPMLYSTDLDGTMKWYTDFLEFRCNSYNKEVGWLNLSHGKLSLMFCAPNAHIPFEKPVCTGSFYFNTQDVDILWDRLKEKVNVCYPIEDFDYGMREFGIYDNNGYLLQFGKEI
jgi:uncharacterized glyoxalase superfamily protein PhnB